MSCTEGFVKHGKLNSFTCTTLFVLVLFLGYALLQL